MAQDPLEAAKKALEGSKKLNGLVQSLKQAAAERRGGGETPGVTHPVPWGVRFKQAFGGAKQFHKDVDLPKETPDERFRRQNERAAGQ